MYPWNRTNLNQAGWTEPRDLRAASLGYAARNLSTACSSPRTSADSLAPRGFATAMKTIAVRNVLNACVHIDAKPNQRHNALYCGKRGAMSKPQVQVS